MKNDFIGWFNIPPQSHLMITYTTGLSNCTDMMRFLPHCVDVKKCPFDTNPHLNRNQVAVIEVLWVKGTDTMSHLVTHKQSSMDFIIQLDWKIYGASVFEQVHFKKNQKGMAATPLTSMNRFFS